MSQMGRKYGKMILRERLKYALQSGKIRFIIRSYSQWDQEYDNYAPV